MMRAFIISTGEMLHPVAVRGQGFSGISWALAPPGSPAFEEWKRVALPATSHQEGIAARLRASLHNSQG